MTSVGVDCVFFSSGSVRIQRVQLGDRWRSVSQGRQWLDQYGRHVLIMLPDNEVWEIVLRPDSMAWEMKRTRSDVQMV